MLNRDWVEEWAKRYDKENEDEKLREDRIFEYIEEIGSPPSYLAKPILLEIANWKASRVKGCVSENDDKFVRACMHKARSANSAEWCKYWGRFSDSLFLFSTAIYCYGLALVAFLSGFR